MDKSSKVKLALWRNRRKGEPLITDWCVKDGKLLFQMRDLTPHEPMSKADVEHHLQRMKENLADTPAIIVAVCIERHIAVGLWNEGSLTRENFAGARSDRRGGVIITMELLGQPMEVRIKSSTYYERYEFLVEDHPRGETTVRDVPDDLCHLGDPENPY